MRPHVDHVRIAYAVRQGAPGADDATAVACEHATVAPAERALHLSGRAPVVEMIGAEVDLERDPVDLVARRGIGDPHPRLRTAARAREAPRRAHGGTRPGCAPSP